MMVEPPGDPTARTGLPCLSTIVGDIEDRGRLSGSIRVGAFGWYAAVKSVSSLLSRKPRLGTTMPEPPVCSMVSVYSTTLPHLSATVRLVVLVPSVPAVPPSRVDGVAQLPSELVTSPAFT